MLDDEGSEVNHFRDNFLDRLCVDSRFGYEHLLNRVPTKSEILKQGLTIVEEIAIIEEEAKRGLV